MYLIVITEPGLVEGEHDTIKLLFEAGLKMLHLRKPEFSLNEQKEWIEKLPKKYRKYIVVHQHYSLVKKMHLRGMHFTESYRKSKIVGKLLHRIFRRISKYSISTSYHNLKELAKVRGYYSYYFFSPVFDSISKPNYKAKYSMRKMYDVLKKKPNVKVIALGGVTPERILACRDTKFKGVALMGELWLSDDPVSVFRKAKEECDK